MSTNPVLQAYLLGMQLREQRAAQERQRAQEDEERAWQRRRAALEEAAMMQKLPGSQPMVSNPEAQKSLEEVIRAIGLNPESFRTHLEVNVPGVPQAGLPPIAVRPLSLEQQMAMQEAAKLAQARAEQAEKMQKVPVTLPDGTTFEVPPAALSAAIAGHYNVRAAQEAGDVRKSVAEQTNENRLRVVERQAESAERTAAENRELRLRLMEMQMQVEQMRQTIEAIRAAQSNATRRDIAAMQYAIPGEEKPTGPNYRRKANPPGRVMEPWLAQQYLKQAGGDVSKAQQWALEDGWDIISRAKKPTGKEPQK